MYILVHTDYFFSLFIVNLVVIVYNEIWKIHISLYVDVVLPIKGRFVCESFSSDLLINGTGCPFAKG